MRLSLLLTALLALSACAPRLMRGQSTTLCLPADDDGVVLVDYMRRLATSADTSDAATRQRYGLPSASASQVALVSDARTRASASTAFNTVTGQAPPAGGRKVYVVQVGSTYVVMDPAYRVGEWHAHFVFTRQWKKLSSFAA